MKVEFNGWKLNLVDKNRIWWIRIEFDGWKWNLLNGIEYFG